MNKDQLKIHEDVQKLYLESALKSIKDMGVGGVRDMDDILDDLKNGFQDQIIIAYGSIFEVFYSKEYDVVTVKTTYSNQVVSKTFLDQATQLWNYRNPLGLYLRSIIQLSDFKTTD